MRYSRVNAESEGLLTFALEGQVLALPVGTVAETVRAVAVTPLPTAPPIVEGVINVRGRVVPVLDIRQRLGLPSRALDPNQHFIIATAGPRLVALRVDHALDVVTVSAEAIASAALVPVAPHVVGIATLADGLAVIHDLDRFLALDEARLMDAALESAGGIAQGR